MLPQSIHPKKHVEDKIMHAKKNMEQTACTLLGGAPPTCGGLNHEKSSPTIFFYLISTVFFFVGFLCV